MAKAPKPSSKNGAAVDTMKITVRGETAIVRPGDFGPRDDVLVRHETKKAFGAAQSLVGALSTLGEDTIGLDTLCLLWWVARRKAGATSESLAAALDGFPTYAEADTAIELAEILPDEEDEDESQGNG